MKAARWVGLGRVECEDVPVPPVADGEVLVRTVYASICGSDLHEVFFETPPPSVWAGHPGHESVGEVVAVGPDAQGVKVGDRRLAHPWIGCGSCVPAPGVSAAEDGQVSSRPTRPGPAGG